MIGSKARCENQRAHAGCEIGIHGFRISGRYSSLLGVVFFPRFPKLVTQCTHQVLFNVVFLVEILRKYFFLIDGGEEDDGGIVRVFVSFFFLFLFNS